MIRPEIFYTIFIKTWRPYLWIIISSFLLYGHVIFFSEYTHYDDAALIKDNYSKIDEFSDIGRQFLEDVAHQGQGGNLYRPMLNISIILGTQISGTELWGHFLINVFLHTGACLLLFVMLLNLRVSRSISFISSLLFTINPVLTQSVAWISGRNDSLLAFFILLCFISFLKFMSSSSYKWYFAHMFFFAIALFTKETTIIFPLVLLFYVFFIHKDNSNAVQIIGLIVCWIIVSINWYILRDAAQIAQFTSPLKVAKNLFSDLWIVFFYFGKILWPLNLAFGPLETDINILPGLLTTLFLLAIIVLSTDRNWKIIFFGLLWFGLCLIPSFVYNLNKIEFHILYYEHRIYVPMIGIVILLSSLTFTRKTNFSKSLILILLGLVIVFFSWKSYYHTFHFQNFLTLRQYAAETSPHNRLLYSSIERMSLPSSLKQQIRSYRIPSDAPPIDVEIGTSIKNCRRTRDILGNLENKLKNEPSNRELLHSLAIVNYARGFFVKAEELFLYAKTLDSKNANISYNLGILYYDAYRYKQSEQEWLSAVKLNPIFGDAYLNLAYLYYQQGQFDQAWNNCQQALKQGIDVPGNLIQEIESKSQVGEKVE
jgi:tetratricopeptide (TPR) repeat protein